LNKEHRLTNDEVGYGYGQGYYGEEEEVRGVLAKVGRVFRKKKG